MERAIRDLARRTDAVLFEEAAVGIDSVLALARRLDVAARRLSKTGHHHAARLLANHAAEEIAKVLLLVDAVRCPPNRQAEKARTLGYFHDRLARRIYVEVCMWNPADFAGLVRAVENELAEHCLDGPAAAERTFPHRGLRRREDDLHVDYVRADGDSAGWGPYYWTVPSDEDFAAEALGYQTRPVVKIACALCEVGITSPAGLNVVAEIWRPFEIRPQTRLDELERMNLRTLEALKERGLLGYATEEACMTVWQHWPFPLWPLDLGRPGSKGRERPEDGPSEDAREPGRLPLRLQFD